MKLGNPNGAAALRRDGKGGHAVREAVSGNADAFAQDLVAVVSSIREDGHVSLRAIASELTLRGIRTRRGGAWQVSNVRNLLRRL